MKPSIDHLPALLKQLVKIAPNFTAVGYDFIMYHDVKIQVSHRVDPSVNVFLKMPMRNEKGRDYISLTYHDVNKIDEQMLNKIKTELAYGAIQHCLGTNDASFLFSSW